MTSIQSTLWVEKHRPETLDEIIGHEKETERLKEYADDDEVPHMIFAGPAGTGKTAAITAFARAVFGGGFRSNLSELNASDERGIDTIRDKVKGIARSNPAGDHQFKIIFLDEADQLSRDAQPALRRIMEDYSDVTRFFLSCNYPDKIIEPLQSRCSMFRFGRLTDEQVGTLIDRVADAEDIEVEDTAKQKIIKESRGDARSAINALQTATVNEEVTTETVKTVVGVVDDNLVQNIVQLAISGDLETAMEDLDMKLLKQGANTQSLADSFLRVLKHRVDMPEPGRVKCIDKLAECEWRVMSGANAHVQFHSLLADIHVSAHLDMGGNYEG
ncbi:MAG: replication factor C small subunit [Halobacteria archaeon]